MWAEVGKLWNGLVEGVAEAAEKQTEEMFIFTTQLVLLGCAVKNDEKDMTRGFCLK